MQALNLNQNQSIRIFDDMGELVIDEVMNPGDILYIPARMAHYGVAEDDCLTFSFGLRYPNLSNLIDSVSKGFCHQDPDLNLSEFDLPLRLSQSVTSLQVNLQMKIFKQ
ncbi:cupin [Haemophilus influenzae]|uniref:Cupin n=1 Tax=Haemophilus influenzae TaxID=727 RepID=A0A2X1RII6_HAEIF|nr:cupin [Haemophilus influenzae]